MTGSPSSGSQAKQGDKFTAWNGFIKGETDEAKQGKYLKQQWRTSFFKEVWCHFFFLHISFMKSIFFLSIDIRMTQIPSWRSSLNLIKMVLSLSLNTPRSLPA